MEEKIKQIIEKEFNAKTLAINRINEGYSHFMYLVKLDKEPFEIIVRFSNNSEKGSNLGKEKYVIDILRKNNIPAPRILAYDKDYMILEKFQGARLDTIWKDLTKEEKVKITKKMGELLSKIHSIKLEKFGRIEEDGNIGEEIDFKFRKIKEGMTFNPLLRIILVEFSKDFARLIAYKHLPSKFVGDVYTYINSNLNKLEYEGKPTLCHGDFMTGHLFVNQIKNEYEITGIIDFEFAWANDPSWDFIKLHRQGFFEDLELRQALEEGHGKINYEALEIYKLMRDIGFAWVKLESGDKEISDKVIKSVEEKINKLI